MRFLTCSLPTVAYLADTKNAFQPETRSPGQTCNCTCCSFGKFDFSALVQFAFLFIYLHLNIFQFVFRLGVGCGCMLLFLNFRDRSPYFLLLQLAVNRARFDLGVAAVLRLFQRGANVNGFSSI